MQAVRTAMMMAISLALFTVAGCGSGGESGVVLSQNYQVSSPGEVSYFYNSSDIPVVVDVDGGQNQSQSSAGAAKATALVAPGDTYNPAMMQTGPLSIEGCSQHVENSKVRVCWTAETREKGQWLLAWMPYVLQRVSIVLGDPGEVDVVVAPPSANNYVGQFDSRDVAVIAMSLDPQDTINDLWSVTIAVHELTHAAYLKIHGSPYPLWLNEAIATFAEGTNRAGEFDGNSLTITPTTAAGYARVQAAGFFLRDLAPEWTYETLRNAVATPDPVKTLTGLTIPEFSKKFWEANKIRQPIVAPGRHTVPPYTAIATTAPITASAPLEAL